MTNNPTNGLVEQILERPDATREPVTCQERHQGIDQRRSHPLDWSQAVAAAAARLEENWGPPDLTGHMLASGLADELAATLCAYGMVAAEVDHMHVRANGLAADRRAPAKPALDTPARSAA